MKYALRERFCTAAPAPAKPCVAPVRDRIPAEPGAYILLIVLAAPLRHAIASLAPDLLPAGCYAYCGSARGPGGLRARLARHLRPDKRPHWHVDRLTAAGRTCALAWTLSAGECDLVAALRAQAGVGLPLPGFGSSDCRRCPAHLLRLGGPGREPPGAVPAKLRADLHWLAADA